MKVDLKKKVLSKNDALAEEIRQELAERGIYCINIISSPGAGKTTILERTCARLREDVRIAVVEGDITTTLDADRVARHGVIVHQIETAGACHLDAAMVRKALDTIDLSEVDLLIIENVGNLVCPAGFDLGENDKAVVLSVPEGDDKPAKYPGIFQRAAVFLLNKIDLMKFTDFDVDQVEETLQAVNPKLQKFQLSAKTGEGLDDWCQWLLAQVKKAKL